VNQRNATAKLLGFANELLLTSIDAPNMEKGNKTKEPDETAIEPQVEQSLNK